MTKPKTKNYVDNKKLYQDMLTNWYPQVKAWKDAGSPGDPPPATEYMGAAIWQIASRFCFSRKYFYLKHLHDDMTGYACLITLKYIHNFDPIKYKNPFAYITFIVNNAYLQFLKKETKNNKAKSVHVDRMFFEQMMTDQQGENFISFMKDKMDQDALDDQKFDTKEREDGVEPSKAKAKTFKKKQTTE